METDEASSGANTADKVKGYIADPEIKKICAAIKTSAEVLDVSNSTFEYLAKPEITETLLKMVPTLAKELSKIARFASMLGPAGLALGSAVDLLSAFGLLEGSNMERKLDEISSQIEELREDVSKGFESLKVHVKIGQVQQRFLPIHDKMLTNVQHFEKILTSHDQDDIWKRLKELFKTYPPGVIIQDLGQMHNAITGQAGFTNPVFQQLAEEGNQFEGENADYFLSTLFLQFQLVVGLEMRAVRMLQLFILYEETVDVYEDEIKKIFNNLAIQRKEHDPALSFEWYLRFRAEGGRMLMSTVKWPNRFMYLTNDRDGYVRGLVGHPGDRGVFIIKPDNEGRYFITTNRWKDCYLYMAKGYYGYIRGEKKDHGPQGSWKFTVKNIGERAFVLTTEKWPNQHMVMQYHQYRNHKGWVTSSGTEVKLEGQIKLFPANEYYKWH